MSVDYKEVESILKDSKLYLKLEGLSKNNQNVIELCTVVKHVAEKARELTKSIMANMGQYTLHDIDHQKNVLKLMDQIICEETLEQLSPLELTLLILCAFLHDIGMAPPQRWIKIFKGEVEEENLDNEEKELKYKFDLFCESRPDEKNEIERYYMNNDRVKAQQLEDNRITEYIRRHHSDFTTIIIEMLSQCKETQIQFRYKDKNYGHILKSICKSHTEDICKLNEIEELEISCMFHGNECVNAMYIAIILRLADILDFDSKRAPKILFKYLDVSNPISIKEWKKHLAVDAWIISEEIIAFSAECESPSVEKSIREFCKSIEYELLYAKEIIGNMHDQYRKNINNIYIWKLPTNINVDKIRPAVDKNNRKKYIFKDLRFTLEQKQIINLLMGTNLYDSPNMVIREMIQNAIDTCNVKKIYMQDRREPYSPRIDVSIKKEQDRSYLQIEDNGMGMDEHIITSYFAKIGVSYYKSEEFYMQIARLNRQYNPISKYGIGVLTMFMVAESVEIETKSVYDGSNESIYLQIENLDDYFWYKKGNKQKAGTIIKIKLKESISLPEDFNKYISNNVKYVDVPIFINGEPIQLIDYKFNKDIYSYSKYDCLKQYEIKFDDYEGISGKARLFFVEYKNQVLSEHIVYEREVTLDDDCYELEDKLVMGSNAIHEYTDSLDDSSGYFDTNFGISTLIESEGELFINGIRTDDYIFKKANGFGWSNDTQRIILPFPVQYTINISEDIQLNLNMARNKIIFDEEWEKFKRRFMEAIFIETVKLIGDSEEKFMSLFEIIESDEKYIEFREVYHEFIEKAKKKNS